MSRKTLLLWIDAIVRGDESSSARGSALEPGSLGSPRSTAASVPYTRSLRDSAGPPKVPVWVRSESGLLSWAMLIAVFATTLLIAMLFNVSRISNDKLEAQNAADSVAYSSSLVQARAMNAITACNHMMGELTALWTMHHAIGGNNLDNRARYSNWVVVALNIALYAAYGTAFAAYIPSIIGGGSAPESLGVVTSVPRGEASVYDAQCLLKEKMIEQYAAHASGSAKIVKGLAAAASIIGSPAAPGLIAAGKAKQLAANLKMKKIKLEYQFIRAIETFAIGVKTVKKNVLPAIQTALWTYERLIAGDFGAGGVSLGTNFAVRQAATQIGNQNMCVGEALGRPTAAHMASFGLIPSATLPIQQDPTTDDEKTQLMRATYPWLQYWRAPVLFAFDLVASESKLAFFYEYHCDKYCKQRCRRLRTSNRFRLFVLEGVNANSRSTDKGRENWRTTNGTRIADEMFCVVGIARRLSAPPMTHDAFLPNTNSKPVMAISQAMIYNANRPKKWERKDTDFASLMLSREAQPVSGWDTLNWTEGATEWKEGKYYFGWLPEDIDWVLARQDLDRFLAPLDSRPQLLAGFALGPPRPVVKLNWQAKLVPIAGLNLLKRAALVRDSDMRSRMLNQVAPAVIVDQTGVSPFVFH